MRDFKEIYDRAKGKDRGDIYSDIALDHFLNPRNVGIIEDADAYAKVGDSQCGDFMEIFLKLDREREIVTDAKCCPVVFARSTVEPIIEQLNYAMDRWHSENDGMVMTADGPVKIEKVLAGDNSEPLV